MVKFVLASVHEHCSLSLTQVNSETGVLQEFGDSTRDLNVEPAWIQGLTGCNVVVAIVDDGKSGFCLHAHHCGH